VFPFAFFKGEVMQFQTPIVRITAFTLLGLSLSPAVVAQECLPAAPKQQRSYYEAETTLPARRLYVLRNNEALSTPEPPNWLKIK